MFNLVIMGVLDEISSKIADISDLITSPVSAMLSPFTAVLGVTFYAFVWFFIEGMIYLKTESFLPVAITSIVFATIFTGIFSALDTISQIISIMTIFVVGAILYKLFAR